MILRPNKTGELEEGESYFAECAVSKKLFAVTLDPSGFRSLESENSEDEDES